MMDKYSWLTLCVFYRPVCSAYDHCKVLESLNMYTLVHPYKTYPFWKEKNKNEIN